MKLTPEQIQVIEATLDLNGLVYDDIKLEVLDHIASEIENKMCLDNRSFEESLKAVFENWKEELKPTTYSFTLGNHIIGPKIFMDKMANNIIKHQKIGGLMVLVITAVIIGVYKLTLNTSILFTAENVLTILTLVGSILLLGVKLFLSKSVIKTSYKFRFNRGFYLAIVYGISRGLGAFPVVRNKEKLLSYSFTFAFGIIVLLLVANSLLLAYQHSQFEKKYAI
jgi:hypothetical protein